MAMVENMADDHIQRLLHELFAGQTAWAERFPWVGRWAAQLLTALAAKLATLAVFDVTGVTAAVVVAFGVVMVKANARRVIKAYHTQMDAKRVELTRAIEDLITQSIDVFYQKAEQVYGAAGNLLQRPGGTLPAHAGAGRDHLEKNRSRKSAGQF